MTLEIQKIRTKEIRILMLTAFVFTISYAISEVSATTPNFHGHKWYWEETDYRYGSFSVADITQTQAYGALDSARAEISSPSDYHADKVTTGNNWITTANWADTSKHAQQYPQHDWLNYLVESDIEFNSNSGHHWSVGTDTTYTNMRAVANHEFAHGVDFEHTNTSGTVAYFGYVYSEWTAFDADDDAKMVAIYG